MPCNFYSPRPVRPLKRKLFEDHYEEGSSKRVCLPDYAHPVFERIERPRSLPMSNKPKRTSRPPSRYDDEIIPRLNSAPVGLKHIYSSPSNDSRSPSTVVSSIRDLPTPDTSFADDSRPSSRVKSSTYRDDLQRNGILLQPHHSRLISSVEDYAKNVIHAVRDSPELSEEELNKIVDQLHANRNEDENTIEDGYIASHLLPTAQCYPGVIKVGSDVPFDTAGLPHMPLAPPLVIPKPDRHYCFDNLAFTNEEAAKMNVDDLRKYAKPSTTGSWPFFNIEFKSEAKGGTFWVADNQNAGSGALCVNIMRKLLAMTDEQQTEIDSMSFSCTIHASQANVWVHYCHQMNIICSEIDNYQMRNKRDIVLFRNSIKNIIAHGVNRRLPQIKSALAKIALPDLESAAKARRVRKTSEIDEKVIQSHKKVAVETDSTLSRKSTPQSESVEKTERARLLRVEASRAKSKGEVGWFFYLNGEDVFSPEADWSPATKAGRPAQLNRTLGVWFFEE